MQDVGHSSLDTFFWKWWMIPSCIIKMIIRNKHWFSKTSLLWFFTIFPLSSTRNVFHVLIKMCMTPTCHKPIISCLPKLIQYHTFLGFMRKFRPATIYNFANKFVTRQSTGLKLTSHLVNKIPSTNYHFSL